VNLFIAGEAEFQVGGATWRLKQEGNYPWDGRVKLVLSIPAPAGADVRRLNSAAAGDQSLVTSAPTIWLRVPGWARNKPVPGDLYRFDNRAADAPTLAVNRQPVELRTALTNGFARLTHAWRSGDVIELDLPMPVRRVLAHPNVKECAGKVALQRGPIVYCFEGADHGGRVLDLALFPSAEFKPGRRDDLLGGTWVLEGFLSRNGRPVPATAIPYHLWSNRGSDEMVVWLPTTHSPTGKPQR
jgi:hypothetical protein